MASQTSAKRFALLVGIDLYQCDGSRKRVGGEPVSLKSLHGCVNDVQAMKHFLGNNFQVDDLCDLTSSSFATDSDISKTTQDRWPSFDNIKRYFNKVKDEARAGDMFFFHFSGYGAQLEKTDSSPKDGRAKDPSLMTVDYCRGNPAVRGWQLNIWLNELNEKKVQVVVSLDSCYSGGAWRGDGRFRSPEDWISPPNLPADEAAATETTDKPTDRDAGLEMSWGINPEGFTLMAACQSNQGALEQTIAGKTYGVYTYEVLKHLNQIWPRVVTYRTLRDQIASQMQSQTPVIYGQDRLAFFGNKELLSAAPILVEIREADAILPIGRIHGVKKGAQFATYPPDPQISLTIDWVDNFKCGIKLAPEVSYALQRFVEVFPSRWSLEEETLEVFVQPSLGSRFQEVLHTGLQDRISGCIEVKKEEDHSSEAACFRLCQRDDKIDISGPVSLIGYEGSVRCLDIKGESDKMRATESALALAHLFRFGQILDLRNQAPQDGPFELVLNPETNRSNGARFLDNQKVKFTFENQGKVDLHFVVLVLSPGFHVKQLYPRWESPKTVRSSETESFEFRIKIPDVLKNSRADNLNQSHRDIFRTVVSTSSKFSVKSLELPDIWDANQIGYKGQSHLGRNAKLLSDTSNVDWWVKDIETDSTS
ncbi:MAG: hypothetical protein L6R38_000265 [Xanthoria sp. 2 TBL-2021]|nr:MAG: hypothetical protein L6R38_000265 [Xanthoria sp. 2 TBL-2021]